MMQINILSNRSNKNNSTRILKKKWTDKETEKLLYLVDKEGENWRIISELMGNKNAKQCMQKYQNSVKIKKKGNWSQEEDDLLTEWVEKNGPTKWTQCAKYIQGRGGKQCRERWINTLNPQSKKGNWTTNEQIMLFNLVKKYLSKWTIISKEMKWRPDNSIKNYFYSSIRKIKSSKFFTIIQLMNFKGNKIFNI